MAGRIMLYYSWNDLYAHHRDHGRRTSSSSFEQTYRCRAASPYSHPQVESGDKVVLPASALGRLVSPRVDYPMLFELHTHNHNNDASQRRISHCGVLEFVAEEGTKKKAAAPAAEGGDDDDAAPAAGVQALDGKTACSTQEASSAAHSVLYTRGNHEMPAPPKPRCSNPTRQRTGKLVFGSSASSSKQPHMAPIKQEQPPKKDEPKFQSFSGK
ncbi:hypothetical protein U9M48_019850, partial [Paspalum notatum var. saurae]